MTHNKTNLVWHKVLSKDELPEGRVTSVTCCNRTLCMTRHQGLYGALGIRVTKASELDAALEKALSHPGPALVEVMTDAELV